MQNYWLRRVVCISLAIFFGVFAYFISSACGAVHPSKQLSPEDKLQQGGSNYQKDKLCHSTRSANDVYGLLIPCSGICMPLNPTTTRRNYPIYTVCYSKASMLPYLSFSILNYLISNLSK